MKVKKSVYTACLIAGTVLWCSDFLLAQGEYFLRYGDSSCIEDVTAPCQVMSKKSPTIINETPVALEAKTDDGYRIKMALFERGSDFLLVLGQGFPGDGLSMEGMARSFTDCDVVCFDYRINKRRFFWRPATIIDPIYEIMEKESKDVVAVVDHCRARKKYRRVVGLGMCYSCGTFASAQIACAKMGKALFDTLIFDSCYLSLHDFVAQIIKDPYLPSRPQTGGAPRWLRAILGFAPLYRGLLGATKYVVPYYSLEPILSSLKNMPVLCIHGANDQLVPLTVFERIRMLLGKTDLVSLITPHAHSAHYDGNRMAYIEICTAFARSGAVGLCERLCE